MEFLGTINQDDREYYEDSMILYAVKNHYYAGLKSSAILTSENLHFFCTM